MSTDTATTDTPGLESVVRKIHKLLARAQQGRGASEAEAETATRMVQELLFKYNLDMADIAAAGGDAADASTVRVKEKTAGHTRFRWQRDLAKAVAGANFCYYMITTEYVKDSDGNRVRIGRAHGAWDFKKNTLHTFVGRKANVITAQLMYDYLLGTLRDLVPVAGNHEQFSRFALSWKEGAADRLCDRLARRKQDLVAAHDQRAREANEAAEAAAAKAEKQRLAAHEFSAKERDARLRGGAYSAAGMGGPGIPQARPAGADDAWRPGAGAQAAPDLPPPSVALVLASVYDKSEEEANYEAAHDMEPGTLARWRREREERRREEEEKVREEVAEQAKAPETERQRRKREREEDRVAERERKRSERYWASHTRKQAREDARRDHSAYRAGADVAKTISLDPQVHAAKGAPRLAGK